MRVPVYLFPSDHIITMYGQKASASFFGPFDRSEEPFIRISTGDYPALRRERGRDNALAAMIHSLSHELIHYWQWLETGRAWEAGVGRKSGRMVDEYAKTTAHP